jgi:hypothetical protein
LFPLGLPAGYDAETGLVRFGARDYDPVEGSIGARLPQTGRVAMRTINEVAHVVPGPVFDRRARFAVGAILGGIAGVLYAPNLQEEFAMLGISRGSVPAALMTIVALSLGCGYLCMKLRL